MFILLLATTFTYKDAGSFQKQWNRDYIVKNFGVNIYTINDFRQSIHPKLSALFDYDKDVLVFKQYYSCKWEKEKRVNKYTNKFKGKNVLFIHAESIQNFLINLKVNGKEVTPNINKFASEGMYFSKFYPQISIGTSSDTEFTLTTGLMPSSSGTVFVNYYDRTYYGMPNYFKQLGYYTFSAHGNNADYWNRKVMHKRLGYDDFYAKDSFDVTESNTIGLGISDKAFFNQMIPILKNIKNEKTNYFGTIITLTNHSPFNDVDKYGDFDLSVNYSYTNSRGVTKTKTSNYLENSSIGNYLKSAHYADEAFGEFIDSLEENNLLENTIIVFYGDHESRLSRNEFNKLYNYDPETRLIKDEENPSYIDVSGYNYDLLKNTPLIIWSNEEDLSDEVTDVMGMYDVLPTIANMFGFEEKYSLGNDIFSDNDKIVVFPNGNVLTNDIYYDDLKDEYITFNNNPIDVNYINDLKEYADKILDVSNGIVSHDLIKNEASLVGECNND